MNSASFFPSQVRLRFPVFGLVAFVLGATPAARADEVVIISNKDNTLYQSTTGSLSNGAGESMFVGRTASALPRRAVVSFDIAGSIPAGSTIISASLTLQLTMTIAPTQTIELRRLTANWGEGTSVAPGGGGGGASSTTGDATWIHTFFMGSFWSTVGGDFSPTITASQSTAGLGAYTWTSSLLASDVQSMLNSPGSNFGWILIGNEATNGSADRFATREHLTASFRPMLIVNFAPVPEPGGLALVLVVLGVFGGSRFRRRRRADAESARAASARGAVRPSRTEILDASC